MRRPDRENDVEAYLVKRVEAAGGFTRKVKWIGRKNAPDRRVVLKDLDGKIHLRLWIELKAPGKGLRKEQAREHDRMALAGEDMVLVLNCRADVDRLLYGGSVTSRLIIEKKSPK